MKTVRYLKEKEVDFYNKIKNYIPRQYQATLCPKPTDDEILEIKKLKSTRANKYKKRKD